MRTPIPRVSPAHDTSSPSRPSEPSRRRFLFALSAGGAGAAAAAAAPVLAQVPVKAAPVEASSGYRETDHVRTYYETTRL